MSLDGNSESEASTSTALQRSSTQAATTPAPVFSSGVGPFAPVSPAVVAPPPPPGLSAAPPSLPFANTPRDLAAATHLRQQHLAQSSRSTAAPPQNARQGLEAASAAIAAQGPALGEQHASLLFAEYLQRLPPNELLSFLTRCVPPPQQQLPPPQQPQLPAASTDPAAAPRQPRFPAAPTDLAGASAAVPRLTSRPLPSRVADDDRRGRRSQRDPSPSDPSSSDECFSVHSYGTDGHDASSGFDSVDDTPRDCRRDRGKRSNDDRRDRNAEYRRRQREAREEEARRQRRAQRCDRPKRSTPAPCQLDLDNPKILAAQWACASFARASVLDAAAEEYNWDRRGRRWRHPNNDEALSYATWTAALNDARTVFLRFGYCPESPGLLAVGAAVALIQWANQWSPGLYESFNALTEVPTLLSVDEFVRRYLGMPSGVDVAHEAIANLTWTSGEELSLFLRRFYGYVRAASLDIDELDTGRFLRHALLRALARHRSHLELRRESSVTGMLRVLSSHAGASAGHVSAAVAEPAPVPVNAARPPVVPQQQQRQQQHQQQRPQQQQQQRCTRCGKPGHYSSSCAATNEERLAFQASDEYKAVKEASRRR